MLIHRIIHSRKNVTITTAHPLETDNVGGRFHLLIDYQ